MQKNLLYIVLLMGVIVSQDSFPESLLVDIPGGEFSMGELEAEYLGPPGSYDAFVHIITLNSFQMSETEISNEQYAQFLNSAFLDNLIEVHIETGSGPDNGNLLVYGTEIAAEDFSSEVLYNLSGTRVMKDHDNDDGDNDSFTGVIEPENPLNIAYIGFDESNESNEWFYVKDPANLEDFDWMELTNYYNYTDVSHEPDESILLNDYDSWSELADYPNNLPTVLEVSNWPATFIRWYGAKAFVLFYNIDLPSEAQWEYAARGGSEFNYSTSDGNINHDGSSANWNYLEAEPSLGHVLDIYLNEPNPFGLYNMAGNVWEWVEDWYDQDFYTISDGETDPLNIIDTGKKVRRGGSWNYHLSTLKSAARANDEKFKGNDHFGFRVVKNEPLIQIGDVNQDDLIDVLDLVVTVDLILNNQYDEIADVNNDDSLDVLDIVELVEIIMY
ncbi:MAG: SUMF1/EgtB/PvdO family nonheme iron enzyme [Candidatus Marinimicrobia bacterium]|nr:SUMF1/EgtB/PvdO family nonheme iron enzyme [Candidatus Neomarinimicrobiota bacterium]MBT4851224.1 SUMF1/EgtB/PvdO family nonheme iron enzyme [Candidatus Neomarinimicrobiota bacterium]MBT5210391.1 SUMF1/EgtB/PvdO family nonheme iron enzyme [Candidatus Neomarinimicrobiota bacterium]MBT7940844.1 SUMF1/EgtB/PvdO family nonheme iron enzyme [Candidatus Neomarinimicrobiota bacterium]